MVDYTLHKVMVTPEPYNNRRSKDYIAYSQKELRDVFGKNFRNSVYDRDMVYSLAYSILRRYDSLDCLSEPIPFRARQSFTMEIVSFLARNLAVYLLVPQRYGGKSRNMLASAFMRFTIRIQRYRNGHGLEFRKGNILTKKEYGYLVDFLDDNEYLWLLAEHWKQRYHQRLKKGHTCPL